MANELLKTIDFGDGIKRAVAPEWENIQNKPENLATKEFVTEAVVNADWNQNDETAKDYIQNRPFGEIIEYSDTLTWDGNIDDKLCVLDSVNDNIGWCFVNDYVLTLDDITNGFESTFYAFGSESSFSVSQEEFLLDFYYDGMFWAQRILGAPYDNFQYDGYTFPKKGIYFYFVKGGDGEFVERGISLTIPGFTGFTTETIKTIDEKFIPDTIARKTDIGVDWNQNDETAPDYIKNRTHWAENNAIAILPEQTVETSSYVRLEGLTEALQEGKTYAVVFNGVTYECVAWKNSSDVILIGNGDICGGAGLGGDEPFSCDYSYENFYLNIIEPGTYTISISRLESIYHHIDRKFLPPMIGAPGRIETSEIFNDYINNIASGMYSHAEGLQTVAEGNNSHAEGSNSLAYGIAAHAEGQSGYSDRQASITLTGNANATTYTYTSDLYGGLTIGQMVEKEKGVFCKIVSIEGDTVTFDRTVSSTALNKAVKTLYSNIALGEASHVEGRDNVAYGNYTHAEGFSTLASGAWSHAEGFNSEAHGYTSHVEGHQTKTIYGYSHAEGSETVAAGQSSHSEGSNTLAYGDAAHAEGQGYYSSSMQVTGTGGGTVYTYTTDNTENMVGSCICTSYGSAQIIDWDENNKTITLDWTLSRDNLNGAKVTRYIGGAIGSYSHIEGERTTALGQSQHVQGKYNIADTTSAHIVGNGESETTCSNAHTLDWDGNAWFSGDVYVGSTSGTNKDEGSKKLATENYVTENYYTKAEVEALIAQAITAAIAASY